MNLKTFRRQQKNAVLMLTAVLTIALIFFSSCQRMSDIVTPPADTATDVQRPLKIGLIQPADYYVTFGRGAELAQATINARGGLLGMQVEFIHRDNQTAPNTFPDVDKTVALATELVEEQEVVALLGPIFSTIAAQAGPTIQGLQRPTILGSAGTLANAAGDFMFLSVITNAFQGKVIAEFASDPEELNAKTAATIQQDQDVYSTGHVETFVARFEALGGAIVTNEVYQAGDTSFSEQLQRIQKANPDVILLSSFAPEVPLLIQEARDMGIETTIVGGDTWDEPQKFFGTLMDNTPLEGIYQTTNFAPEMPGAAVQQFFDAYMTMFGTAPDGIASSGYDAMLLLANAIEQANSTDPIAIRDALAATKDFQGSTYISHYDENRHPVKSLAILTVRDGELQTYKIVEP